MCIACADAYNLCRFVLQSRAAYDDVRNDVTITLPWLHSPILYVWKECTEDSNDATCSTPEEIAFKKVIHKNAAVS